MPKTTKKPQKKEFRCPKCNSSATITPIEKNEVIHCPELKPHGKGICYTKMEEIVR